MAAVAVDVAKAILNALNSDPLTDFGVAFTAVRSYAEWDELLEDLDTLHVDVVPAKHRKTELADRGGAILHEVGIHVATRKRLRVDETTQRFDLDEVDDLVLLTEKISDHFIQLELATLSGATWIECKIISDYVRKHLRTNSQYTGIVEIAYEVID